MDLILLVPVGHDVTVGQEVDLAHDVGKVIAVGGGEVGQIAANGASHGLYSYWLGSAPSLEEIVRWPRGNAGNDVGDHLRQLTCELVSARAHVRRRGEGK